MKQWYAILALALLSTTTGFSSKPKKKDEERPVEDLDKQIYSWTHTFGQVLELVKTQHYSPTHIDTAYTKAMDSFLAALDPHSGLLDPKAYKLMLESTSGEFFGVGIVIDNTRKSRDRFLIVVDTIPDGPADKEGVKPMDKIFEVDGETVEGKATEEVIAMIKGAGGTKVNIKVMREAHQEPLSFDIERDVVKEQSSLSFEIRDQDIYYLSLSMFSQSAIQQIEDLLKKSKDKQYRGVILDLRNNSGGLLNAVVEIAGLFLPKSSLVVKTKDRNGKETSKEMTKRAPITNGQVPIFILINNYTASAAEILAGCLKIHSEQNGGGKDGKEPLLVFLVGTSTFGKGSVQEVKPISNDCAAKVTTSLYYLPGDVSIQGTGIVPDFPIERTLPQSEQMVWFTKNYGRENTFENFIKPPDGSITGNGTCVLEDDGKKESEKENSKKDGPTRWTERAKEMLQTDNQLRATISLINLFNLYRSSLEDEKIANRVDAIEYIERLFVTAKTLDIVEVKS